MTAAEKGHKSIDGPGVPSIMIVDLVLAADGWQPGNLVVICVAALRPTR